MINRLFLSASGEWAGKGFTNNHNVVAVFTDSLPPPEDLSPFMPGLFRERELPDQYSDWNVELFSTHILEDEHPGGVRHMHPVNKVVAQRPI